MAGRAQRAVVVSLAAALVALAGFGWYVVTGDDTAPRSESEQAYLREVRADESLRSRSDDDVLARGRQFCDDLREEGSSLRAVFRRQVAGEGYEGQGTVATAARRHLCRHLPDADSS